MDKELLKRYVQGKCSKSELFQINEIFKEDNSDELKKSLKNHWETEKNDQPLNLQMARLLLELRQNTNSSKHSLTRTLFTSYQRIAAVLLIPLLIASLWILVKPTNKYEVAKSTIVSPMGGRVQFTLPDGTSGWLNSGSTLSYNTSFKERQVDLNGEAYFDVTHRNKENFVVNTSNLLVEVLGTKFNVSDYAEDTEPSVVLNKGKVKISNQKGTLSRILKPNERFKFNKSKSTASIFEVNSTDYIAWKDGYLKFRGETFSEVVRKMERWYNIEVSLTDKQLRDFKYRGTFKDEQLEEVLRLISLTAPLSYTIHDRSTNKQGSYNKRKVIIEMKK